MEKLQSTRALGVFLVVEVVYILKVAVKGMKELYTQITGPVSSALKGSLGNSPARSISPSSVTLWAAALISFFRPAGSLRLHDEKKGGLQTLVVDVMRRPFRHLVPRQVLAELHLLCCVGMRELVVVVDSGRVRLFSEAALRNSERRELQNAAHLRGSAKILNDKNDDTLGRRSYAQQQMYRGLGGQLGACAKKSRSVPKATKLNGQGRDARYQRCLLLGRCSGAPDLVKVSNRREERHW